MATPKAAIETMDVGSSPIERYRDILGAEAWSEFSGAFSLFAERLRGRILWNVNSTPRGGGVADVRAHGGPDDVPHTHSGHLINPTSSGDQSGQRR